MEVIFTPKALADLAGWKKKQESWRTEKDRRDTTVYLDKALSQGLESLNH